MDRVCPSYGAGYDACDPFAAVLNGQSESRAARVLRRRCRSEGIERSPYEDTLSRSEIPNYFRPLPKTNSSMTTSDDDCRKDLYMSCLRSTPTNGEYLRLDNKKYGYLPVHQKSSAMSPLKPLLITKDDSRLPKVEEFLEKDHEYVTIAKQPLKSILNNPLPISQPQGILKKPKNRSSLDSKLSEGRRRQRASSESDNFFCNYGTSPAAYDCRVYSSNAMKRAKDNSGTGYSYGTAVASLSPHKCFKSCSRPSSHYSRSQDICDRSRLNCQRSQDVCDSQSRSSCLRSQDVCDSQSRSSCLRSQDVCDSQSRSSCLRSQEVCDSQSRSNCSRSQDVCDIQSRSSCLRSQDVCDSQSRSSCMSSQDFCDSRSRSNYLNIPENGRRDQCDIQVLRTTAINEVVLDFDNTPMSGCNSPVPTCPVVSPALPVSSETPGHPIKTTGCITMKNITKLPEHEDHSRSPSMDRECDSDMETDPIQEEEITNSYPLLTKHNEQNSMSNLSLKLTNGAVVSKKNHSKEHDNFLISLHTTNPFKIRDVKDITPEVPENMKQALRQSLFPRVPPYIKFVGHDDKNAPKLPISIQKHLIWKLTTITPIVVKNTLINSGFRLVKSDCDTSECPQEETIEWVGIWGKHMKSLMFRAIKDGQKMNHFPGTFQIGRKDRLWRNLQKLVSKYGSKEFGIMPKTYILPNDMKLLKHDWEKHTANNEKWIIKPPASARGTGIKVISRWTQIPKKRPVVVQKYVSKPYLINGSKFDIRLYVLVTSVHPLRIYLHNDGLARFASVKYNDEPGSLNDRYMHLTNYSINRLSKNYTPNEDFAACEGHKWTLQTLFHYLKTEKAVDTQGLWESLKDLVIKTVISGESGVTSLTRDNVTSRYTCYELFGVDVLLEQDLKPWLLEVNISPSLHSASPLDIHVKAPLVSAVLNLAQFQLPVMQPNVPSYDNRLYTVYLSKEERDKHTIYTKMDDRDLYVRDILSTLTPDDVRHLIQAEDELTQVGCMERIFPTQKTHRYLGFLNGARYYNRLFDAWETHYGLNRDEGIERLRKLCDIGYHQCVPPPPLKNNVEETQASRTT